MKNKTAFTTLISLTSLVLVLLISRGVYAQSINTGDADATTIIENQINTNVVDLNCCTPTPEPTEEITPTPTTEQPTPTPTSSPSGGGGGNGGGVGGGGGEAGPAAAAPAVLGLAAASGEDELLNLLKLLPAFAAFATGYSFLRKNA